jgi:uncharacterized coiled-coil protein SlyX
MLKSEDKAWTMFENLSNNSRQQASNRRREPTPKAPKTESLFEVGHSSNMSTQVVEAITKVDAIAKKLDQIMIAGFAPHTAHTNTQLESCSFCSSTMHHVNDCPTARNYTDVSHAQVNAAFSRPGNDPYFNTYNLGWRNHPNFSWKNPTLGNSTPWQHNQAQSSRQPYQPSSTYRPPQQQDQAAPPPRVESNFEDRMLNMMSEMTGKFGEMNGRLGKMNDKFGEISQTINSHSQSIAKLETQIGQMANTLNRREEGKLPSQPVVNPKGLYMVNEETSQ